MRLTALFAATALTGVLVACGGGGGGGGDAAATPTTPQPSVDLASKYEGTWETCVAITSRSLAPFPIFPIGAGRIKETLTIVKTGPTSFSYKLEDVAFPLPPVPETFPNLNCVGTAITSASEVGAAEIVGSKTVGGKVVDEIVFAADSSKDIIYTDQTTLLTGNLTLLDSDGFPQALDSRADYVLTKK